jgi:hypothetical protein
MSSDMNETMAVMLKLSEPLLHEGCTGLMVNFYSSLDPRITGLLKCVHHLEFCILETRNPVHTIVRTL